MAYDNSDTRHLRKIGSRYYARVRVPRKLVKAIGKAEIQKALGTGDLAEAQRRRWAVVDAAHRQFAAISGDDEYLRFVAMLGENPAFATTHSGDRIFVGEEILSDKFPDEVEELSRRSYEREPYEHLPIYQALQDNVDGMLPIRTTLERFLEANTLRLKDKGVSSYRKSVERWIDFVGERPIERATRAKAVEFADSLQDYAPNTKGRIVRNLARLFEYATRRQEQRPQNPFRDLVEVSQATVESYTPYSDEDILRIYEAASPDTKRALLFALYSGMRRSELLRAEVVHEFNIECFKLTEGKTRNAVRLIPVHPLLSGLERPQKSDSAITVELGRLHKRLGITERGAMHRARKSFATKLERAGVAEGVAARLLGHKMATLSYGLYSGGQDVSVLADAVKKVRYPDLEANLMKM